MEQKFEQDYQVIYDLITEDGEFLEYTEETLKDLKNRAESIFGPKGLNLATIEKCYLEERIYDTFTKWVVIIDLHFIDLLKFGDIQIGSLEEESINRLIPLEELRVEKEKGWDNLKN